MSKISENDIVRLKVPEGDHPESFVVRKNGKEYRLEWGSEYRVSHHCDPDNKVASLDFSGAYPLVRDDFVQQHRNQFEIIKNED